MSEAGGDERHILPRSDPTPTNESAGGALRDHGTMAARADDGTLPGWAVRRFETLVDGLTNGTPEGERARGTTQGRLEPYDGVRPRADLGDRSVEGDRERRQSLFSLDESAFPDGCPWSVAPGATAPDAARGAGAD